MEDNNFEFDLESLCDFLSPSIFSFFSINDNELISDLDTNTQSTSASSSIQDHIDPFQKLDAHLEVVFAACSQQMDEEEGLRQQASTRELII